MPCDCGPDTRRLWEKVRDLMEHHDAEADRWREVDAENRRLRQEIQTLKGIIADYVAKERNAQ